MAKLVDAPKPVRKNEDELVAWYAERFGEVVSDTYYLGSGYEAGWYAVKNGVEMDFADLISQPHYAGSLNPQRVRQMMKAFQQGKEDSAGHVAGFAETTERIAEGTPFAATIRIIPSDDEVGDLVWLGVVDFDNEAFQFRHELGTAEKPYGFFTGWSYPTSKSSGAYMYSLLRIYHEQIVDMMGRAYPVYKGADRKLNTAFTWLREALRPFAELGGDKEIMVVVREGFGTNSPLFTASERAAEVYRNMTFEYAGLPAAPPVVDNEEPPIPILEAPAHIPAPPVNEAGTETP